MTDLIVIIVIVQLVRVVYGIEDMVKVMVKGLIDMVKLLIMKEGLINMKNKIQMIMKMIMTITELIMMSLETKATAECILRHHRHHSATRW